MPNIAESFVGIDVSKDRLDIHVLPGREAWSVATDQASLEKLGKRLRGLASPLVVMEATGGYERASARALRDAGLSVAVVNPRQVRDFGRSIGRLAKTDGIDAALLAFYGDRIRPEPRPEPENIREIRALVVRRRQIITMLTAEKTRLQQCDDTQTKAGIAEHIAFLKGQIKAVGSRLADAIKASKEHASRARRLATMPGVGDVLARTIVAHMPELGELTRHTSAALAGLAPYNRDSGKFRGKRKVWGGRADLRKALYMPALSATRKTSPFNPLYRRLRDAGKPHKVAMIAVMRKMIVTLNAMIRDKKDYKMAAS